MKSKKQKPVVTKNSKELVKALGLTPSDGIEIDLRSEINAKIVAVVKEKVLTHAQAAELAGTSRTRMTAILNFNTQEVSTDLLLRVLRALGYVARVRFERAA